MAYRRRTLQVLQQLVRAGESAQPTCVTAERLALQVRLTPSSSGRWCLWYSILEAQATDSNARPQSEVTTLHPSLRLSRSISTSTARLADASSPTATSQVRPVLLWFVG